MLYGIETAQTGHAAIAPSAPYVASAVTFSSASLVLSSLTCTDNQYFGMAGWFRTNWTTKQVAWVVDPDNNYNSIFFANTLAQFAIGQGGTHFLITNSATNHPNISWHHVIAAGQTNFAAGGKIVKMKLDGVDVTSNINDTAASFSAQSNGLPFWVGSDDNPSNLWAGDMCDLSIWAGINLLTSGDISSTTIQLFRTTGGAPVDPHVAIAALGHPPIMLSGDATHFRLNSLGTSGAFTLTAGTITNAASHP